MAKGIKTGGRQKGTPNKNTADLKALASKHGPAALKAIRALAETAEAEQVRLSAWRELLDRGYGKPPQYSEIGSKGGAPMTLVVETGVPARAIEPPMVDITPDTDTEQNVTHIVTHDDVINGKTGIINGLDDEST